MSDYIPVEVIAEILKRLPVKSVGKCRSVCKSWNTLISRPSFISAHLQASLSKPFLLIGCKKRRQKNYFLHHDNDVFDKFKKLQFTDPFSGMVCSPVVGSCNGLICVQLYPYEDLIFLLWNPLILKFISLPPLRVSEAELLNVGFGFGYDSRTNDYKLLIVGVDKNDSWIEPRLFSLNENCWKRVTAFPSNYAFDSEKSMPFVNGAVHWLGHQERNDDEFSHAILGFDLSAEEFFEINLPETLTGLLPVDLSIMKYGESSIAVFTHPTNAELRELWVMKEYGVVESWTKVLTLQRVDLYASNPWVLGFRKNGEVLLSVHYVEMASLDLTCQPKGASLYLNCQQIELHGVDIGVEIYSVSSYVESLVLLDETVNVYSYRDENLSTESSAGESDVNLATDSSDSDESSAGESDVNLATDSSDLA